MIENYKRTQFNAIKQINVIPFKYDENYVETRYDTYPILCDMMSHLRLGFISGVVREQLTSVLDVGYGNGSFLKICQDSGITTYGTDVSNYELKYGLKIDFDEINNYKYDLITFFDSLEHFENIDFLSNLNTKYIMISVPNCNYDLFLNENSADEYFTNWKHRRENEHIWHFDKNSLKSTIESYGYRLITSSHIEDNIRKPVDGMKNILTQVFQKCTLLN